MNRDSRLVVIALLLLILTSWSPLIKTTDNELVIQDNSENRYDIINVDPNQLHNLEVIDYNEVNINKRPSEAWTRIGIFNSDDFIPTIEIPEVLKEYRTDLKLVIVNGDIPLTTARTNLNNIEGLTIREYI